MNATEAFLGDEPQWLAARIELEDVQALWGGRRIELRGSGLVNIQLVERGMQESRYEFSIGAGKSSSVVRQFIEHDFLTIHPTERPGIPDEARPRIALTNAAFQTHTVAKWAGVKNVHFDALYAELAELEKLAEGRKSVYTGPSTHTRRSG